MRSPADLLAEANANRVKVRDACARLLKNPDYLFIFVPEFAALYKHHSEACMDNGKEATAAKRAEHVEAAHLARKLISYLQTRHDDAVKMLEDSKK